jgi:hypothetical protein
VLIPSLLFVVTSLKATGQPLDVTPISFFGVPQLAGCEEAKLQKPPAPKVTIKEPSEVPVKKPAELPSTGKGKEIEVVDIREDSDISSFNLDLPSELAGYQDTLKELAQEPGEVESSLRVVVETVGESSKKVSFPFPLTLMHLFFFFICHYWSGPDFMLLLSG